MSPFYIFFHPHPLPAGPGAHYLAHRSRLALMNDSGNKLCRGDREGEGRGEWIDGRANEFRTQRETQGRLCVGRRGGGG